MKLVRDILDEAVEASSVEKTVAAVFFKEYDKTSVMDLRPTSKFCLSLDEELQETIFHEVYDSIDGYTRRST